MWRLTSKLTPVLLIAFLFLAPTACKRKKKNAGGDEPTGLATMLHAADPRSAVQLLRGFHTVEAGAWRWTMKSFAVTLKAPSGASAKGATLLLKFALPEIILQKLGPVTITAKVGNTALDPQTYSAAGDQTYTRDVPASALKDDAITVEFALDKALPASEQDQRELGIIMNMVGFEAKP